MSPRRYHGIVSGLVTRLSAVLGSTRAVVLSPFLSGSPSMLEILPFWIIWVLLFGMVNIPPEACADRACSGS